MKELIQFLNSTSRNRWVHDPNRDVQLYVRRSSRFLGGQMLMPVFDLSNVIVRSTMRSSGRFTALMDLIEDQVPKYGFKAIYIESVLEPRLESFISRRGYTRTPDPHPYCYFKMV